MVALGMATEAAVVRNKCSFVIELDRLFLLFVVVVLSDDSMLLPSNDNVVFVVVSRVLPGKLLRRKQLINY